MDEVILRFLQGRATRAEQAQLRAWREASPANERQYRATVRTWYLTRQLAPRGIAPPPAADELIRRPIRTGGEAGPGRRRLRIPFPARRTSLAAAIGGLLLLGGLVRLLTQVETEPFSFGVDEFSTGGSEQVTVRLADGSIVRLAADSRLRLIGRGREVWLDGQAFFGVAANEQHPFVVRTRMGDAVVVGTRFDVRVRGEDLRLVVVDGNVALSAAGEQIDLGARQMTVVAGSSRPAVVDLDDVYSLIDWLGQSLIFQNTPLPQAVRELREAFGIEVDVLDPVLASRTVTAWFTDESFEEAFSIICAVVGATCAIQNGAATMSLLSRPEASPRP